MEFLFRLIIFHDIDILMRNPAQKQYSHAYFAAQAYRRDSAQLVSNPQDDEHHGIGEVLACMFNVWNTCSSQSVHNGFIVTLYC